MSLKDKIKANLIKELKESWKRLQWPGLPPFHSRLNEPACKLMELDTFTAGCISQIIQKGDLPKKLWPILKIDNALTAELTIADDPKSQELLNYKLALDECIRIALNILDLEND